MCCGEMDLVFAYSRVYLYYFIKNMSVILIFFDRLI